MTDPIADMLSRIRNALNVGHEEVQVPFSRTKFEIVKILHQEGFVGAYRTVSDAAKKNIELKLRYGQKKKVLISHLRRISRPGRRVYVGYGAIPIVRNGMGLSILSTPKGILSDRQARTEKVGGEILCTVD